VKFLTIAATSTRRFTRDRTAIFWTFAFPIMLVIFLNLVYAQPSPTISILVVNQDDSQIAGDYVSALENALKVTRIGDATVAEDKVRGGEYVAAVIIPEGFGGRVLAGDAVVRLLYDETRAKEIVSIVIQTVEGTLGGVTALTPPPATLEKRPVHGRGLDPVQHIVPSVAIMCITISGAMAAALSIHEEREKGTLERHLTAPITKMDLLGGQMLSVFLICCLSLAIIFAIGFFAFGLVIRGSLLLVALICALTILLAAGLGLAIVPHVRSPKAAEGAVMTIVWPMFFLGGLFVPIEFLPEYMQTIARIFPFTYAMGAFRSVIVHGEGLFAIALPLTVVVGFTIAFFALGLLLLKWEV